MGGGGKFFRENIFITPLPTILLNWKSRTLSDDSINFENGLPPLYSPLTTNLNFISSLYILLLTFVIIVLGVLMIISNEIPQVDVDRPVDNEVLDEIQARLDAGWRVRNDLQLLINFARKALCNSTQKS